MIKAAPEGWRPREVALGGPARLSCYDSGGGDQPVDVVFLHANGFNARTYCSLLRPIGRSLRVLLLDQQGHGGSAQRAPAAGRRNAHDLRDDLLAFLDAVSPSRPVVLAGHSLGGCVSVLAAAQAPARVRGLALFDPVILPRDRAQDAMDAKGPLFPEPPIAASARKRRAQFPSREAAFLNYRGRGPFASWPDEMLADYVEDGFQARPGGGVELACAPAWEASNFLAHAHDIWGALESLSAPLTILRAQTGSTCALTDADELPGRAISVTTLAGATHFLPMERPAEVRNTLMAVAA